MRIVQTNASMQKKNGIDRGTGTHIWLASRPKAAETEWVAAVHEWLAVLLGEGLPKSICIRK